MTATYDPAHPKHFDPVAARQQVGRLVDIRHATCAVHPVRVLARDHGLDAGFGRGPEAGR